MSKSDRSFLHQFSLLIAGLGVLTLVLIFTAWTIYEHEPKETDPNAAQQLSASLAPNGAVYAGNTGRAAMEAAKEAAAKAAAAQVAFGGSTDGKTIFEGVCTSCHTAGVLGAPKLGSKEAWAPRIAEGIDTLVQHAINGYHGPDGNTMPPKGNYPSLNDAQVKAAVTWMVDQSK
jgi:cytochrome c5